MFETQCFSWTIDLNSYYKFNTLIFFLVLFTVETKAESISLRSCLRNNNPLSNFARDANEADQDSFRFGINTRI